MSGLSGLTLILVHAKGSEPAIATQVVDGVHGSAGPAAFLSGDQAYAESLAVKYVQLRHLLTRDRQQMSDIWSPQTGQLKTLDPSFQEYLAAAGEQIVAALNAGVTSEAIIRSSREMAPGQSYTIDFDYIRRDATGAVTSNEPLRAYVGIAFDPAQGGKLENPLGLQVSGYSEEPRGHNEQIQ